MQLEPINFDDTETAFAYRSNAELKNSNLVFATMNWPWLVRMGTTMAKAALDWNLPVKALIKKTLFNQFCGGESITDCAYTIRRLGEFNVQTILDYSVEGLKNEDGYEATKREAQRVIDFASENKNIRFCVLKLSGLGSTQLMTQAQEGQKLSEADKTRLYFAEERVDSIIKAASEAGLRVMLDAEESWFQNYVDGVAYRMMQKYNQRAPMVYNTYQFYRHDMLDRLKLGLSMAIDGDYHLGAKLVRGAYMEKERDRAEEKGVVSPIHENKALVDQDYHEAIRLCFDYLDQVGICAGTHNEDSSNLVAQCMMEKGLDNKDERVYFAQLLGMSDNISFKLANLGYNVAKYVPYGPVEKVLPYLFRRAEENTSIAGQSSRQHTLVKRELKRRQSNH